MISIDHSKYFFVPDVYLFRSLVLILFIKFLFAVFSLSTIFVSSLLIDRSLILLFGTLLGISSNLSLTSVSSLLKNQFLVLPVTELLTGFDGPLIMDLSAFRSTILLPSFITALPSDFPGIFDTSDSLIFLILRLI